MSKNPVAKNNKKFNKAQVHVDKKKASKKGYEKHKGKDALQELVRSPRVDHITSEILNELLDYDELTGELTWKHRHPDWSATPSHSKMWNTKFAGKKALSYKDTKGYLCGNVLYKLQRTHRVIWCMVTGGWPENDIDHIDGDRTNNKWSNLRSVTKYENKRNMSIRSDNSTGVVGVSWDTRKLKWSVRITDTDSNHKFKGYFSDFNQAAEVRKYWEGVYKYHENHGRVPNVRYER